MNDDEDFERYLQEYSEITVNPAAANAVLDSVQLYQQRIQNNNVGSIFDTDDYYLDSTNQQNDLTNRQNDLTNSQNDSTNSTTIKLPDLFEDPILAAEPVIHVPCGRGRGGRNISFKAGDDPKGIPNDDWEILKHIRKVAPIGFSNEVTENAVRAHHRLKHQKTPPTKESDAKKFSSTSKSKYSSSSCNSPTGSKPGPVGPKAISSSPNNLSSHYSSNSLMSKHVSLDPNAKDLNPSAQSSSKVSTEQENFYNVEKLVASPTKSSAETKPVPLSELLRLSREQHKERSRNAVIEKQLRIEKEEEASRKTIEEILRMDREEEERQRSMSSRTSTSSSNSSLSVREDPLSWRRRNDSPPRFAWGQREQGDRDKRLNIRSTFDFPPLT